jgi:hypothetical protein
MAMWFAHSRLRPAGQQTWRSPWTYLRRKREIHPCIILAQSKRRVCSPSDFGTITNRVTATLGLARGWWRCGQVHIVHIVTGTGPPRRSSRLTLPATMRRRRIVPVPVTPGALRVTDLASCGWPCETREIVMRPWGLPPLRSHLGPGRLFRSGVAVDIVDIVDLSTPVHTPIATGETWTVPFLCSKCSIVARDSLERCCHDNPGAIGSPGHSGLQVKQGAWCYPHRALCGWGLWSSPHPRLLRRDHDRLFDAFKIAHGHIRMRVLELEILRAFDRQLPAVIIAPRPAVDRDLPARAGLLLQPNSPARFIVW